MNDLYLLVNYLSLNSDFQRLAIGKNTISLDGKVIDFTDFDIKKFISQSEKLLNDMQMLSIEDVFKIIKLHVDYAHMIQRLAEEQAKQMVDNIVKNDPSLSNLHLFNQKDNFGKDIGFLHYVDEKGNNRILADVTEKEFLEAYMFLNNSGMSVSESNIFNYLASQNSEIMLENLNEAEKRDSVSEEHLNNFKEFQDYNNRIMESNNPVLGNEEYGIYLNNGVVHTIRYNKDGRRIVEKHDKKGQDDNNINKDKVEVKAEEQLISFAEYNAIITGQEDLSPEDVSKIRNFENFLSDVIAYKEYLTEDLYQVYNNFYKFWNYLATLKETTRTIEEAKERYEAMEARSNARQTTKIEEKVAVLTRKNDNQSSYGFVSAALYIGLIILVGVVIAVIAILAK